MPAIAKPADLRTRLLALKEAIEHEEAHQFKKRSLYRPPAVAGDAV